LVFTLVPSSQHLQNFPPLFSHLLTIVLFIHLCLLCFSFSCLLTLHSWCVFIIFSSCYTFTFNSFLCKFQVQGWRNKFDMFSSSPSSTLYIFCFILFQFCCHLVSIMNFYFFLLWHCLFHLQVEGTSSTFFHCAFFNIGKLWSFTFFSFFHFNFIINLFLFARFFLL